MKEIPQEQRFERYDTVPQSLRDALNSEVIDELLWTIGGAHHLGEERTFKMVRIYGLIILGFIHPQDLQKEMTSELNIDKRLTGEIAHELQVKILNPLLPEINAAFNYHITGVPSPVSTPTASLASPEIIRPVFTPPSASDEPFILHEEREETKLVRPADEALVRPSFYEDVDIRHQTSDISERSVARLEIGPSIDSGQVGKREPRVGKTEEPQIRVVHYSGPQTPVDPFGDQRPETRDQPLEVAERKTETPEDIHPENIVDLKDLPK